MKSIKPCLYIYKDDEMIMIPHNAFEVYNLPSVFDSYGTVRAIAAINDERYEMNWTFAARMVE